MPDRECFLRHIPTPALEAWLAGRLGTLVATGRQGPIAWFRAGSGAAVTVTPNCETGPFTSVYVVGDDLPWPTDAAFARDAAAALGGVVRCALPGEQARCLELSAGGERIVDIEPVFGVPG